MALVIKYFANLIYEVLEKRDTRLDHLPLTSPLSAMLLVAGYAYFVRIGPSLMSKRKPFQLHQVIIVYDILQIVLNCALFIYALYAWCFYKPEFSFACQPVDWSTSPIAIKEAESVYYFYCLKVLDLADTVFFVLRKKARQISFLHVYHHLIVVMASYQFLGWSAGGHFIIVGLFNSFVHAIMYTYYLISAYRPELKENIEMKKTVTKIQMLQFVFLIYFFGRPLLATGCSISKPYLYEVLIQNVVLFTLFSNFYYRNYK